MPLIDLGDCDCCGDGGGGGGGGPNACCPNVTIPNILYATITVHGPATGSLTSCSSLVPMTFPLTKGASCPHMNIFSECWTYSGFFLQTHTVSGYSCFWLDLALCCNPDTGTWTLYFAISSGGFYATPCPVCFDGLSPANQGCYTRIGLVPVSATCVPFVIAFNTGTFNLVATPCSTICICELGFCSLDVTVTT